MASKKTRSKSGLTKKSAGIPKGVRDDSVSATTVMSDVQSRDFERELCWCVEQLELGLSNSNPDSRQARDAINVIRVLKNPKAPIVKKRQAMRATFGDYRKKIQAEEKQITNKARKITLSSAEPSAQSTFYKQSESKRSKVSEHEPETGPKVLESPVTPSGAAIHAAGDLLGQVGSRPLTVGDTEECDENSLVSPNSERLNSEPRTLFKEESESTNTVSEGTRTECKEGLKHSSSSTDECSTHSSSKTDEHSFGVQSKTDEHSTDSSSKIDEWSTDSSSKTSSDFTNSSRTDDVSVPVRNSSSDEKNNSVFKYTKSDNSFRFGFTST